MTNVLNIPAHLLTRETEPPAPSIFEVRGVYSSRPEAIMQFVVVSRTAQKLHVRQLVNDVPFLRARTVHIRRTQSDHSEHVVVGGRTVYAKDRDR